MKWVHVEFFYWVIQIGVLWVGEMMECKSKKSKIFVDVAYLSSNFWNLDWEYPKKTSLILNLFNYEPKLNLVNILIKFLHA